MLDRVQPLPILIVGAGLGGLSLAQGLRKAHIPFLVFEKDERANFRAQGYRIRIGQDGLIALQSLLPEELYTTFGNSCAQVIHGGHQVNAVTAEAAVWEMRARARHLGRALNADRTVLRNVLLQGLEDNISFGKRFKEYELVEGGVVVHFSDGSSAQGTLLVGADGIHSKVARQMLPSRPLLDTEARAIFGKTPITDDLFAQIPKEVDNGICVFGNPNDTAHMKLFCDTMHFQRGLGMDLPPDYVYWVLVFQRVKSGRTDMELLSASKDRSTDLSLRLTEDWHESCRSILAHQDPEAVSALMIVTGRPDTEPWTVDKKVTLLGDAAHPMTPVGGAGANAAFEDAAALLAVLQVGVSAGSVKKYEECARDKANKWIIQSAGGAAAFFGMKPLEQLQPVSATWTV